MKKKESVIIPKAHKLEASVLGAFLMDSTAFYKVKPRGLCVEDFDLPMHKVIFEAIESIAKKSGKIDLLTVVMQVQAMGKENEVTPFDISEICQMVASTANVEYHASQLQQVKMKRKGLFVSAQIQSMALSPEVDCFDMVETSHRLINSITENIIETGEDVGKTLDLVIGNISGEIPLDPNEYSEFGIADLDDCFGGIWRGDIITIGAQSGVGKTAFMMNFVLPYLAAKKHIAIFSYEMSIAELLMRLISIMAEVDLSKIRTNSLEVYEVHICKLCYGWLKERVNYLHLIDCAGMSIETLRAKCLQIQYLTPLQGVFIDYVQLIAAPNFIKNVVEKQAYNCIALQHLKKELGCPFFLASQVRKDNFRGRPTDSDLKGAQELIAISTKIFMLDNPKKRGIEEYEDGESTDGFIDIYADKVRAGKAFSVRLKYDGYCYKFRSIVGLDKPIIQTLQPLAAQTMPCNEDLPF